LIEKIAGFASSYTDRIRRHVVDNRNRAGTAEGCDLLILFGDPW